MDTSHTGAGDGNSLLDSLAAPSVVLGGRGDIRAANVAFTQQCDGSHRCLPLLSVGDSYLDAFADHRESLTDVLAGERDDARSEWQCPDLACGRWWSLRTRPLRGMDGAVVTHVDVSQRKRLEEQLRQSQKLEAVGRLAAGVAHDLNNVMTAVLGYADLLALRHADVRDEVDGIRAAVGRARALVDDLLAFSQRRAGSPGVHDLNEILRAALPAISTAAGEGVVVEVDLHPGPCPIRFERALLEQVIANLVDNAREAMPAGGTLRIASAANGSTVVLRIGDSGDGMDEQTRTRAVEPFFTTRGAAGHAGLGLSTAYGIVAQARGDLVLHSRPGAGTVAVIELPLAPTEDAAGAAAAASAEPDGAPSVGTILLVEDEDMIRDVMASVLTDQGYTVLPAATGEQALNLAAAAGGVDLVVTDVQMPGMDGPTLVETLRRDSPRVAVLFMTGYTERRLDGVVPGDPRPRLLRKPFGLQDLLDAVATVLRPS